MISLAILRRLEITSDISCLTTESAASSPSLQSAAALLCDEGCSRGSGSGSNRDNSCLLSFREAPHPIIMLPNISIIPSSFFEDVVVDDEVVAAVVAGAACTRTFPPPFPHPFDVTVSIAYSGTTAAGRPVLHATPTTALPVRM